MPSNNPNQTIPTTATPAIVDFTAEKQSPSFSGPINEVFSPVTYSNAGNNTLTISDVFGGFITHTAAGAQTDTLPSAALLVPQIEGAQVGSAIELIVKAGGAGTITIAAGTGGTTNGTMTIATGNLKFFLIVVTALPDASGNGATYTVYSLGTSVY